MEKELEEIVQFLFFLRFHVADHLSFFFFVIKKK